MKAKTAKVISRAASPPGTSSKSSPPPAGNPQHRGQKTNAPGELVKRPCRITFSDIQGNHQKADDCLLDFRETLVGLAAAKWAPLELLEYFTWQIINNRNFLLSKVLPHIKHPLWESEFREMLIIAESLRSGFTEAQEHFNKALDAGKDEASAERERIALAAEYQFCDLPGLSQNRRCNTQTWLEAVCLPLYSAAWAVIKELPSLKEFDKLEYKRHETACGLTECLVIAEWILEKLGYKTEIDDDDCGILTHPTALMRVYWTAKTEAMRSSACLNQ